MGDEVTGADISATESTGAPGAQPASDPGTPTGAAPATASPSAGAWSPEDQARFTKERQALAEQQRQFTDLQKRRESEYQLQLQQLARLYGAAHQQKHAAQPTQQPNLAQQLRALEYLDGNTAAALYEELTRGMTPYQQAIQQQQQYIGYLNQQLGELRKAVGTFQTRHRESEFGTRLKTVRAEMGLPDAPWVDEFLKDIYLSHTGDDLDDEFPKMARERWDTLQKAIREADKRRAEEARQSVFATKGGSPQPSAKLSAARTVDEIVDAVAPSLGLK